MRVLAVKMEDDLFDEVKAYVKEQGLTTQKYVNKIIERDIHKQEQAQEPQTKEWERDEVEHAIKQFIQENGRVPSQKEFKNENGLPSYKAAARCLQDSPAQFAQKYFNETQNTLQEPEREQTPEIELEQQDDFSMNM